MALPDSYTVKYSAIPDYLNAIQEADPPERFSHRFLQNLGFSSTNDRLFIGILKDLGFIDENAVPQQRYFDFLDRTQSAVVLAQAIREAYSDLFAVNKNAQELTVDDVRNKLRTLYAGKKTDLVIERIAKTFESLVKEADFTKPAVTIQPTEIPEEKPEIKAETKTEIIPKAAARLSFKALEYHINIVLPESRDQAVYDAIFKSLREHLG